MTERTMSREEALELLKGGAEGISEWNRLRAEGVKAPPLKKADLERQMLIWANLRGLDLEGASLMAAHLEGANLENAHLESARLGEAHLEGAHLFRAHLDDANLSGANLEGADLIGAQLKGAHLIGAHLQGACLSGAHLQGADFILAHLQGANLSAAHLEGAHVFWAHLDGAYLREAYLERTILSGAHLQGADLREAHLQGADLKGAHLQGADLRGAHLEGVVLTEVRTGDYLAPLDADNPYGGRALRRTNFGGITYDERTKVMGLDASAANFAGAALFKRHIQDKQYLAEFEKKHPNWYLWWEITCDCGRSFPRWAALSAVFILYFGLLFSPGLLMEPPPWWVPQFEARVYKDVYTPLYFSAVTFTTLGFGDVLPKNFLGQYAATLEVIVGYLMLGALISILADKVARRA